MCLSAKACKVKVFPQVGQNGGRQWQSKRCFSTEEALRRFGCVQRSPFGLLILKGQGKPDQFTLGRGDVPGTSISSSEWLSESAPPKSPNKTGREESSISVGDSIAPEPSPVEEAASQVKGYVGVPFILLFHGYGGGMIRLKSGLSPEGSIECCLGVACCGLPPSSK